MFFPFSLDPETIENQIIYFDPKKLVGLFAMATPFRRPYVSWRVVSSIGELRGCTISGTRQHAGQAIAPIPRSSGDGPVEIQRRPISAFSRSISLIQKLIEILIIENFQKICIFSV